MYRKDALLGLFRVDGKVEVAALDRKDVSPPVTSYIEGRGRCGWCTLGRPHSEALHQDCMKAAQGGKRRRAA